MKITGSRSAFFHILMRILMRIFTLLIITSLILPSVSAAAEPELIYQTIEAEIFTDHDYTSRADDNTSRITLSGRIPAGVTARAYPVQLEAEAICAFDISLLDGGDCETEPPYPLTVELYSQEIESASSSGKKLSVHHLTDGKNEEIAVKQCGSSSVSFEAESFSVYYVSESAEIPSDKKQPRRTYIFKNCDGCGRYSEYEFSVNIGNAARKTSQQTVKNGESLFLPQLPSINQKSFIGWFEGDKNAPFTEGRRITSDKITDITEDGEIVYLYAVYGDKAFINFHFEDDTDKIFYTYETVVPENIGSEIFLYGSNVSSYVSFDLSFVKRPSADGKIFVGWSLEPYNEYNTYNTNEKGKRETEKQLILGAAETVELFPIFEEGFCINFSSEGGNIPSVYVPEGSSVHELPLADRTGYSFKGWYTYDNDGNKIFVSHESDIQSGISGDGFSVDETGLLEISADITLYAEFEPFGETEYTVVYWAQKKEDDAGLSNEDKQYDFIGSAVRSASYGEEVSLSQSDMSAENIKILGCDDNTSAFLFNSEKSSAPIILLPDSPAVLNVYFDRRSYTLSFSENSNQYKITALYRHDISLLWCKNSKGSTLWQFEDHIDAMLFEMPPEDRQYTAYTASLASYTDSLHFYIENLGGTGYEELENCTEIYKNRQSAAYIPENAAVIPGFTHFILAGAASISNNNASIYYVSPQVENAAIPETLAGIKSISDSGQGIYPYSDTSSNARRLDSYYVRSSFTLSLVDGGSELLSTTVKFGDPLSSADLSDIYTEGAVIHSIQPEKYYFDGWYLDPCCQSGGEVSLDETLMPDHYLTLFAKWSPVEYSVELDPDGGILPPGQKSEFKLTYGEKLAQVSGVRRKYVDISRTDNPSSYSDDVKYYCIHGEDGFVEYAPISKFENSVPENSEKRSSGEPKIFVECLESELVGWYRESGGRYELYNFDEPVSGNIKLRAVWREVGDVCVSYSNPYGKLKYTSSSQKERKYGCGSSAVISCTAQSTSGAQFAGWSVVGDEKNILYSPGDSFVILPEYIVTDGGTKTIMLAARFEAINAVALKYDINGGIGELPEITYHANNSNVTLPNSEISNPGYYFIGWSSTPDGSGDVFYSGKTYGIDSFSAEDGVVILYAVWRSDVQEVPVRYFLQSFDGTLTELDKNDPSDWYDNKLPPSTITVGAEFTDISYSLSYQTQYALTNYSVMHYLKNEYTEIYTKLFIGIGDESGCLLYDAASAGTQADTSEGPYLKSAWNGAEWSKTCDGEGTVYDFPAVFVIYSQECVEYNCITVKNIIDGDGADTNDIFDYKAEFFGEPKLQPQFFSLKNGESRNIMLLSSAEFSQSVSVTQLVRSADNDNYVTAVQRISLENGDEKMIFTNTRELPLPSGKRLTLSHLPYISGDNNADAPKLLNGSGQTLFNHIRIVKDGAEIEITRSSGLFDRENGEADYALLKLFDSNGYFLEVSLAVMPDDDNEYDSTYLKIDNEYSGKYDSGIIKDIRWEKQTDDSGIKYRFPISELLENGELKTESICFYSLFRTNKIKYIFRYYDRIAEAQSDQPINISSSFTEFELEAALLDAESDVTSISGALTSELAPEISSRVVNNLENYYFFASQEEAVTALSNGTALSPRSGDLYGDYYSNPANTLHTDCYGRVPGMNFDSDGRDMYMSEEYPGGNYPKEKWVTYLDGDGNEVELSADCVTSELYRTACVVIWGFNAPRQYTIKAVIPESSDELKREIGSTGVMTADENEAGDVRIGSYYYNEIVGASYGESFSGGISAHLDKYGNVLCERSNPSVEANEIDGFSFEGWYIINNDQYVKISSDIKYSDRVTTGLTIYAGYTQSPSDRQCVTLFQNDVERFTETINNAPVDKCRYVTVINCCGFGDSCSELENMAVLYVVMPSSTEVGEIEKTVEELICGTADDSSEAAVRDIISSAVRQNRGAFPLIIAVDGSESANNTVCMTYEIIPTVPGNDSNNIVTSPDTQIKFSNKNRAQITFEMKESSAVGGVYSKLLVFAAVEYNGEVMFSDNYVIYSDGEAYGKN